MKRLVLVLLCTAVSLLAQPPQQPSAPIVSPEVSADGHVTVRVRAPNAKEVFFNRDGLTRQAMQKDDQGVWSITAGPYEPDFYGYSFNVDGVRTIDPNNSLNVPNLLGPGSMMHIPGAALPWEVANVPHGEVHRHLYHSSVAGDDRDLYVYTPPNYDPGAKKLYPVLYLLHGFSDDARGWGDVGFANVILDNLIAQGKAKPMLVVMPLGYGVMDYVLKRGANRDQKLRDASFDKYRENLFTEIIPYVETNYHVAKDRNSRAIAGLSMGGAESLTYGLGSLDRFAWIGAFSSGGLPENYAEIWPSLDAKDNARIKLLWIACGTEDRLIEPNRKVREWLTSKQIKFTPIETPGAHVWMVWRRNLAAFAPLLF